MLIRQCLLVVMVKKVGNKKLEKLKKYKEYGINRLSIGLQSANDKILKKIGRIHDYKQFEETFFYARKCGFKNINVDLMIGLPTQAVEDVKQTLEKIIQKNPALQNVTNHFVDYEDIKIL